MNPELLLDNAEFIRRLARSLVRGDAAADDLVQDTWVATLERPPREGPGLRAWLSRVVRNTAVSNWRRRERRSKREAGAARRSPPPTPSELLEREELRATLVGLLKGLPAGQRDALVLCYLEGIAPREIAARLDLPVETVKTRLQRGLATLRKQMDRHHGGDRRKWVGMLLPLAWLGGSRSAMAAPLVAVAITTAVVVAGWVFVFPSDRPKTPDRPTEEPIAVADAAAGMSPNPASPTAGESTGPVDLRGRWRMIGNAGSVLEFQENSGVIVVDGHSRVPFNRLQNGDILLADPDTGFSGTYRPKRSGDRLTLTLVAASGEPPRGAPAPAAMEGQNLPDPEPEPEPDLPPAEITLERIPEPEGGPRSMAAAVQALEIYYGGLVRDSGAEELGMAVPLTAELGKRLRARLHVDYRNPLPLMESHLAYLHAEKSRIRRQLARVALATQHEAVELMIERRSWLGLGLQGRREAASVLSFVGAAKVAQLGEVLSDPADPVVLMALMCRTRHTYGCPPRYLMPGAPQVPDDIRRHWAAWLGETWPGLSGKSAGDLMAREIGELRELFNSGDRLEKLECARRMSALIGNQYPKDGKLPSMYEKMLVRLLKHFEDKAVREMAASHPIVYESL